MAPAASAVEEAEALERAITHFGASWSVCYIYIYVYMYMYIDICFVGGMAPAASAVEEAEALERAITH